ncbi:MAG: Zn-dependent alcohol dehydrogenase [Deinococcus sp.]|uniref:Zn-dependent alcohol dehydrogenase n=1 Tax=Deinococcus sp. TaxID=47478 RepID=UPI0026DB1574|nr:Zn-dependent alcohol dehydrogenase [Deinococcus sp.]MDO4245303.1 Zn-dependent alcohol dehydrogenase [Deinococcus sp.]
MKVRAAVLNEENVMPSIETVTLADPAEGQVRVKVMAAGVCHSDLSAVRGVIPQTMPLVLGHEGAGIVEAVGEGVTRVSVGDHVIFSWVPSCGECYFCQHERPDMCDHAFMLATLGTLPDGTTPFSRPGQDGDTEDLYMFSQTSCLAEYTVVPEKGVVPIGKDVPFEVAAITGCAVMTGVGAALKSAGLTPGRRVAVIGCGGVGLNVIQGARLAGASQIIAMDHDERKLDDARRFGATHTIATAQLGDPISAVLDLTDGLGVDDAFEVVGRPETIQLAYGITRKAGQIVVVGVAKMGVNVELSAFALPAEAKHITGSWYGQAVADTDFPRLLEYYRQGDLRIEELISHRFALEELPEALEALERGEVRRAVIVMGQQGSGGEA